MFCSFQFGRCIEVTDSVTSDNERYEGRDTGVIGFLSNAVTATMLTSEEDVHELPYLAMYSILKAVKATGDTCMAKQEFKDAALHYTRALEWGIKSGHLTNAKVAALHLARSNAYLSLGELCKGEHELCRARVLACRSAGRAEDARKDAEDGIRLRPSCPKVRAPCDSLGCGSDSVFIQNSSS